MIFCNFERLYEENTHFKEEVDKMINKKIEDETIKFKQEKLQLKKEKEMFNQEKKSYRLHQGLKSLMFGA